MNLHNFGSAALLLIVTALLAVSTIPGGVSVVVGDVGISPEQSSGLVVVTVLNCAGNPVTNAVIQLQGLSRGEWTYTGSNGVAQIVVPPGTYTLQGGYGTSSFSQTLNVGTGVVTLTVSLGVGCSSISSSTSTSTPTQNYIRRPH
jgi:hypothetical protein